MELLTKTENFVNEICAIPGGEGIRVCIQCGTCTASCPNANKMDHTPSELIAMARAGMRREVLASNAMWYCLSCYLCTVRCPRGIKLTGLMHAMEALAVRGGVAYAGSFTPTMYRSFNHFACALGSMPELGFMTWYYMWSNPLRAWKMIPIAVSLFRHGRLSIKARRLSPDGESQLRAILEKAETLGGVG
jgi:heterodisulfide reductase subunit C